MPPSRRLRTTLALLAAATVVLAACGDDDGGGVRTLDGEGSASASGSASGSATGSASGPGGGCRTEGTTEAAGAAEVGVTLEEWQVTPDPDQVAAGPVTFEAANEGKEEHELVIVRAASASELPIEGGGVDEDALPEGAVIGEIEPFGPGKTCEGTFELAAGDYVLLCNIVEEEPGGAIKSHVEEGMVTSFTVG